MKKNDTQKKKKASIETVSIAFTWSSMVPTLIALLREGDDRGRIEATLELRRMAQAADLAVKLQAEKRGAK